MEPSRFAFQNLVNVHVMVQDIDKTDENLMELIVQGDHQAFSTLVHRHTDKFFGVAFRLCGHVQDAEDVVQDAFIKLWHKPESWDKSRGAKFTTWFYRVVSNMALDYIRRRKPAAGGDALDAVLDGQESQEQSLGRVQEEEMIERAIETLPDRQKLALTLCFYEGLSNKDAAEVMNVKVKALESLLMRAKSGLRDELSRHGMLDNRGNAKGLKDYG